MIIDIHTHIGRWNPNTKFSKEDLLNVLSQNGVEYFGVSNLDGIGIDPNKPDITPYHDEISANKKLLKTFKDIKQALLFAVCEPRHGNPKNIKLLLHQNKNKFVGLKFHSEANQVPANSELYDGYLELAKEFDLPCLFHSGDASSPYSSAELIYQLAQRHPDVKIILGHLSNGHKESKIKALQIMHESIQKNNCKLYCDISWCEVDILFALINNIPLDRIMFGSDAPMVNMKDPGIYNWFANNSINMIKANFAGNSEEIIAKIFYGNAKEFFKLK